jgi:cellulase
MVDSQQPGDRSCKNEAIGGNHYGPVLVYMTKVPDASKADGSTGWFKVYEDGWAPAPGNTGAADNDYWGVKDMNKCCGKVDFKIPTGLAPGDYLVRAEVVALHTAQSAGGAQFYMSCCK